MPYSSQPPLWIKICANTSLADALLAADLGADALGFVFAPSPRQVTPAQVAAITPHLPAFIEKVGVFIGSTPQHAASIASAAQAAGLTAIQLHGGVDLPFATLLRSHLPPTISLIHTTHWTLSDDEASAHRVAAHLALLAPEQDPRLLIDAKLGPASGGLGVSFNWARAAAVIAHAKKAQPALRVIVAGGLRPENVAEAIAQLEPHGVDLASGIEQRPGKKDPELLQNFIRAARGAI